MKLLILTQAVDTEDPVMGFFVRWIDEFAKHHEHIEVICLTKGKYDLPANVRVHSLGKEKGASRVKYVVNFYTYIWRLRHDYDAVFVHMNQEYPILGGWLWKLLGKRVYMWRNYHGGTFLTDIAMAFCTKVFCTSRFSYTAKSKKAELMPVGVDTERFFPDERILRVPSSILFLSGMWPSKRPEVLIDALAILHKKGVGYTADFYGSPLPSTEEYYASLKERVLTLDLEREVSFHSGVPNSAAIDLYRAHELFVNCSPSGMFDKTLFEAAACGALVVASSGDFAELVDEKLSFPDSDAEALAERLAGLMALPANEKGRLTESLEGEAAKQSLATLGARLAKAIHS